MTNILPEAPNSKVLVGRVLLVDSLEGSIYTRLNVGSYFKNSNDVQFGALVDKDIIRYNDISKRWENIPQTDLELIASQVSITDIGEYYNTTEVESVLQEIGLDINTITTDLLDTMSSGVLSFSGLGIVDTTHFSIGTASGIIINNITDPKNPTITRVEYAGSPIGGLTTPYLLTHQQTEVFIDNTNSVYLTNTPVGTASDRRDMIFLGRIIHPNDVIVAVENIPQIVTSPLAQLRDLWRAIGIINEGNYVYPNDANLQLAFHGGALHYSGLNFINDNNSPTKLIIPSATPASFLYRTQNGTSYDTSNLVDPLFYDLNGARTVVPQPGARATNQRVFLTRSGLLRIQYGQHYYANLTEAVNNIAKETFITSETLLSNSILIGIISIQKDATDLSNTTYVKFTSTSKFGELGGGGGSGGAANASDVAISDIGNYYTGTNVESVLQEVGDSLSHMVTANTKSVVTEGAGIDVASSYNSSTDTYTYNVSHEDTSTLTGKQGTNGIKSVTVDGMGHVTGIETETYLTTESFDYKNIIITDNDTGYTWTETGSIIATKTSDTVTFVSDGGIDLDVDTTAKAIKVGHSDTSTIENINVDNSNGTVLQDISFIFDGYGHTQTINIGSYNLDNRYYTETEIDATLGSYQLKSEKGSPNGYASLDIAGKIPGSQLPSYVDDVLEYPSLADFPTTGENGKIYIAVDTTLTYRWTGSVYVVIGTNLALGETEFTAYRGDRGKIAYDHSQSAHAPADAEKNVNADWSAVDGDAQILNKPTTLAGYGITDAVPSNHIGKGGDVHAAVTTEVNGFMIASDKVKLDNIASGAEVNVKSNWNEIDENSDAFIQNKPIIPDQLSDLLDDETHRLVTDTDINAWYNKQNALGFTPENIANKAQPNGYASLDANGLVPENQLPIVKTGVVTTLYNRVVLETSSSEVLIGIANFNKDKDVLMLYQNSTYIALNQDYSISSDNLKVINLNGTWAAGTVIDLTVFQNTNEGVETLSVIFNSSSFTAISDLTTHCSLNYNYFNPIKDRLLVYYKNLLLFENVDYTINADKISIDLIDFSINTGEVLRYEIWKKIKSVTETIDGSYLENGTVTFEKLDTSTQLLFDKNSNITTTSTSETALVTFDSLVYTSAKLLVQATRGSERQISELLVIHDGTTAYATEYGTIITGTKIYDTNVDILSGSVRVLITSTSSVSTVYKTKYELINI